MSARSSDAAQRGTSNLLKMVLGRLATQLIMAVSVIVIARRLGAESYGLYAAVLAIVSILQVASNGGLPMVEVRFLAPLWQSGERGRALDLASTLWTARLGLGVLGAGLAAGWLLLSPRPGLSAWVVPVLGLFCLLRYAWEATRSLLLPLGHSGKLMLFELLRALFTLPTVVLAFALSGIEGVFVALAGLFAALLVATWAVVRRVLPVTPWRFRWELLRPRLGYSFSTFVGTVADMVQAQLAVYAVGTWVAGREAGVLALSLQFFAIAQGLYLTCRRALLPVLAELEEAGEVDRLKRWLDMAVRYGGVAATLACVGWALLGRDVLAWLLSPDYGPAYRCVAVVAAAVIFYSIGVALNGLLYIRGRAQTASANSVIFALLTCGGLLAVLRGDAEGVAWRVCWVYLAAAAAFAVLAWLSAGLRAAVWLSPRRIVPLLLPALLAWPFGQWQAGLGPRLLAALGFVVAYLGLAVALGGLPAAEAARLWRRVRRRISPRPAPVDGSGDDC